MLLRRKAWHAALLLGAAIVAHAQTATFSPQGAAALRQLTGTNIKGFQLIAVEVCSDTPVSFGGGFVYRAATRAGFAWQAPEVAQTVLERTSSLNWRQTALIIIGVGSSTAAMLTSGGIVAATSAITSGLIVGHGIADQIAPVTRSRAPDPRPVTSRLILEDVLTLPQQGCFHGYIGAKYPGGPASSVTVALFDPTSTIESRQPTGPITNAVSELTHKTDPQPTTVDEVTLLAARIVSGELHGGDWGGE